MAVIREELVLQDSFTSTFGNFITEGESAIKTLESIQQELSGLREISQQSQEFMTGFAEGFSEEFSKAVRHINEAESKQARVTQETMNTANAAGQWASKIKGAIATLGLVKMGKTFIDTADELSLINSRLDMINDGTIENQSLQNAVYQAALRSRGAWTDTANLVIRIGQNAKDTFNNAEAVKFGETMNKAFKIAGANQAEIQSATLQLSQALATGVLRGEEFNAVNEAAPIVIQKIAEAMGKTTSEMRQMAQDGQITAEVVKNAMLGAAGDIDREFATIPLTWGDYVVRGTNMIQMGISDIQEQWNNFINDPQFNEMFDDVVAALVTFAQIGSEALMGVANAIAWVHQNWESLLPIIDVIVGAIIVYEGVSIAAALASAAAWIAANWPLVLLAIGIGVAIGQMQAMGVTFSQVGSFIGGILGTLYAVAYNIFANIWNVVATFAEFFANVFNDPVTAIVNLFTGAFDAILGVVETVAGAIDSLLGTNMSGAIAGFRSNMSSWVSETFGDNAIEIQRMANLDVASTSAEWANVGSDLGGKLDNMNLNMKDIGASLGSVEAYTGGTNNAVAGSDGVGKVGSVGKVEQDVKLSDEDLKVYRDLAEMRYLNKVELKTLAPQINVEVPKGTNLSPTDVADAIKAVIIEQSASHTATAHA